MSAQYEPPLYVVMPADTPENRARWAPGILSAMLEECGGAFPEPYKDSVPDNCEMCGADVWVGPVVSTHRAMVRGQLLCMICAVLLARREGVAPDDIKITQLTDKKWGE